MSRHDYVGGELDLFAHARSWKRYWSSEILPYLSGDVLEVGAGMGANTPYLKSPRVRSWTCLEPDPGLAEEMRRTFAGRAPLADCRVYVGTTQTAGCNDAFDAILYIDVLEHIPDDRDELARASHLLRAGGKLIVLSPAYAWLYTPFDRTIGHVRRYDRRSLLACSPTPCKLLKILYLDSVGVLASLGNRLVLKQSMPSIKQIRFWDRYLVPASRLADRFTFNTFGKSILAIWIKP